MSVRSGTHGESHLRSRIIDFALYIAIGILFIISFYVVAHKWGPDAFIRWGGLVGYTAILFGYFIADSRRFFRNRLFWVLTLTLLSLHVGVFVIVLTHAAEWRLPWFMVVVVEVPVFLLLRSLLPRF
jgi:hypothetical protein